MTIYVTQVESIIETIAQNINNLPYKIKNLIKVQAYVIQNK